MGKQSSAPTTVLTKCFNKPPCGGNTPPTEMVGNEIRKQGNERNKTRSSCTGALKSSFPEQSEVAEGLELLALPRCSHLSTILSQLSLS